MTPPLMWQPRRERHESGAARIGRSLGEREECDGKRAWSRCFGIWLDYKKFLQRWRKVMESLILAQSERWRHGLGMQVGRPARGVAKG